MKHAELRAQELRTLADKVEAGEVFELVWAMRMRAVGPSGVEMTSWQSQTAGEDKEWQAHLCKRLAADVAGVKRPKSPAEGLVTHGQDKHEDPSARNIWDLAQAESEYSDSLMRASEALAKHFAAGRDALMAMRDGYRWTQVEGELSMRGGLMLWDHEAVFVVKQHKDGYVVVWELDPRVTWVAESAESLPETVRRASEVIRKQNLATVKMVVEP